LNSELNFEIDSETLKLEIHETQILNFEICYFSTYLDFKGKKMYTLDTGAYGNSET
jgi:hypothetical protein